MIGNISRIPTLSSDELTAPGVDADVLTEALGEFGVGLCAHLREETEGELLKRDRKIGILEGEIRELKGFVGGVLTLLGKSQNFLDSKDASNLKAADDTPRIRKVHDAA